MAETNGPDMLDILQQKEQRRIQLADKIWDAIVSKKLLVWLVSSYLFMNHTIDKDTWEYVTMMFLGAEGLVKAATAFKGGVTK